MLVMVGCGLLALAGLLIIGIWGGHALTPPARTNGGFPLWEAFRRTLWWANVSLTAGITAGILLAGAGGRLVMRLLAATSPQEQGRLTEANETIGEITLNGTIGFIVFAGLFAGLATALLYSVLQRWLPSGRLGGAVFGSLLLVGLSAVEPLRAGNRDFQILGPGWLSVLAFGPLAVLHGMLVAAAAGRLSRAIPLLRRTRDLWAYAPLLGSLLLLLLSAPAAAGVVIGAIILAALAGTVVRWAAPNWEARWRQTWVTVAGRVVITVAVLAAVPAFTLSVSEILAARH
ncbi:hypothetical protein [Arthrobacter crystallopoietes]|uniref:Uncharacterized protein n=1 Tax=Crystallibacter crystallopoietes TaxID=37928 RepID=A0A1H1B3C2_9MICC|nr:hypothetical protein [Arthrobacter crystallopoietes]AUI51294.1 hypothetical protein AC20117_11255 [Arthrobacter crystallopoietes]SDQ46439.1 hypothetical protein SAMN04489742_1220 [Arthrobacter crystallopoietes]